LRKRWHIFRQSEGFLRVRGILSFFHFIGFGLLITTLVAGLLLESQFRRAQDTQTKLTILRSLRRIGLLSPIAMLIMLITGIGNMQATGSGIFTHGWLTAKIMFFALVVISGVIFAIKSRKRGALVESAGTGKEDTGSLVRNHNRQVSLFYIVLTLLMMIILFLSVWKP
jgi:uncharacterized membrane protein SirB2